MDYVYHPEDNSAGSSDENYDEYWRQRREREDRYEREEMEAFSRASRGMEMNQGRVQTNQDHMAQMEMHKDIESQLDNAPHDDPDSGSKTESDSDLEDRRQPRVDAQNEETETHQMAEQGKSNQRRVQTNKDHMAQMEMYKDMESQLDNALHDDPERTETDSDLEDRRQRRVDAQNEEKETHQMAEQGKSNLFWKNIQNNTPKKVHSTEEDLSKSENTFWTTSTGTIYHSRPDCTKYCRKGSCPDLKPIHRSHLKKRKPCSKCIDDN
jgi:hypothetical protein